MAGQSVGLVNEIQPLQAIMDEMIGDAEAELQRLQRLLGAREAVGPALAGESDER
jgi:hypothetical protein